MDEFDSLFVAKSSPEHKTKKEPGTASRDASKKKKKQAVQVISAKRGMNGGISLARIKIPFEAIAEAINSLKEGTISTEQLSMMKEFLPEKDEAAALQDYLRKNDNSKEELCECEKFMCAMLEVNSPAKKIDALVFKSNFVHRRNDIIDTAKHVETACDDVRMSIRLKKLLAIILKVGNQLNHGGGEAHAFTINSLLKLNQSKAFDRKTTILHYLVMLVKRNDESLLHFKEDISSVVKAAPVAYELMVVEELAKLKNELHAVKKVALKEAERATKEDGGAQTMIGMTVSDYASQKTSLVRSDSGVTHHDKAVQLNQLKITPIGRFSIDASAAIKETEEYTGKVSEKFKAVLKYFGESSSMPPMQFFNTLSTFTRAFDKAVEDVNKEEKKKAREKRLEQMKKAKEAEKESKVSQEGKDDSVGSLPSFKNTKVKNHHGKKISARRASTMGDTDLG